MTIWHKVGTLFRASAREPMEKLVDANAIRIFEQEIRETEQAMLTAKRELACLMAEGKRLARSNGELRDAIRTREKQAREALEKREEDLALTLADRIAEDENLLAEQQGHADRLSQQEIRLKQHLREAGRSLQGYQRELNLARANRNAEQVLRHLGGRTNGLHERMADLHQSLERIKGQQSRFTDMDEAMGELQRESADDDLNGKLRKAGIDTGQHDGSKVLSRLRSQQTAS